jgi:uncharacterized protein (TIGR02145 family)
MKTKTLLLIAVCAMMMGAYAQEPPITLTFNAQYQSESITLDSIKIMNRTQGGETLVYWPDTTLSLEISPGDLLLYIGYATFSTVGITEGSNDITSFSVYQNFPNPMADRSEISMYIPHTGKVHLMITDLQGRVVLRTDRQLDGGYHSFMFHPGGGNLYFLTVYWNGMNRSIQMLSTGRQDGKNCRLDYVGINTVDPVLKASVQVNDFIVRQSGMLDSPEESTTYTFQFATNIPCPGTPTVEYEGQVYNTIQIFSQCWLKENLNVGNMINGSLNQTNNDTIEKYCYDNEPANCAIYGGLYQWDEMMGYSTVPGTQGICPPGWHLPTNEEWKVLAGAVDSQYGIGDPEWDISLWGFYGYDAGTNLKTSAGWYGNGNGTDLFGFSGLPGGIHVYLLVGINGYWFTSTEDGDFGALKFTLSSYDPGVEQYSESKETSSSVRCLRD